MAFGRDIVIHLADSSVALEDVRDALANFVTVLSLTEAPSDAATLHARLLSSTHVDHLLNVLSGRLRVGRFLCAFARPADADSDEDETLVEDVHGSFHDAFLTPSKSASSKMTTPARPTMMTSPPSPSSPKMTMAASSSIDIPMLDKSSVFLTPPASKSQSPCNGDLLSSSTSAASSPSRDANATHAASTIPIGLHPEITVLDPSPERPENRAPRRRATELAEIFDRYGSLTQEPQDARLAPNDESDSGFLPLAPPYHLLPNTPYFRNALIAPPPLKPPAPLQRIFNRYLASMKVADNLDEMEVQSLMCFNFNRTIGACPNTLPEKAPLTLSTDDNDDIIDEDWSIWSAGRSLTTNPTLTH